jgi:hypothetical protein
LRPGAAVKKFAGGGGGVRPTELLERAKAFALAAAQFYRKLPKTPDAQVPGVQFLKASSSVSANYHAAQRGRSRDCQIAADAELLSEAEQLRRLFANAARAGR